MGLRRYVLFFLLLVAFVWANAPAFASSGGGGGEKAEGGHGGGGKEGGKKGGDDTTMGGRFAGDPIYVRIPPMVLTAITDEGVQQFVTIQVDIEVKDFNAADEMHSNMPRVKDALMRALYGGLGDGSLRKGKVVDIEKVKAKATTALKNAMGEENIKNVLIQGVSQRML